MKFEKLLSPGKIGTLDLKNRFVVPPMGTNFGSADGFVTDKIFVQLHHCGRQTSPYSIFGETPEAPSKIACPVMDCMPEEMSNERVWEVIDEFGDAAVRAKAAGADGVEVHT